jgi:hypothetical protein
VYEQNYLTLPSTELPAAQRPQVTRHDRGEADEQWQRTETTWSSTCRFFLRRHWDLDCGADSYGDEQVSVPRELGGTVLGSKAKDRGWAGWYWRSVDSTNVWTPSG